MPHMDWFRAARERLEEFKKSGLVTTQMLSDLGIIRCEWDEFRHFNQVYTQLEEPVLAIERRVWRDYLQDQIHKAECGLSGKETKKFNVEVRAMEMAGRIMITIFRPGKEEYISLIGTGERTSGIGIQGIHMDYREALPLLWHTLHALERGVCHDREPALKLNPYSKVSIG